jgi:hypothetical protein
MYTIKFVEHEAIFYQLGSLQTFDMTCELFEYNNETFDTGIPDIDQVYAELDVDINTAIASSVTLTDIQAQNEEFETDGQSGILDFSEMDPFSEGNDY